MTHWADPSAVEELAYAEVEQFLHVFEAVDIHVHDRHDAAIAVDEDEGGAGDGFFDAERPTEALDERGLPRSQVAGQQDEVARPGHARHLARQRPRVVH